MNFYNKTGIKKVLGEDDKQVRNLFKRLRLIQKMRIVIGMEMKVQQIV